MPGSKGAPAVFVHYGCSGTVHRLREHPPVKCGGERPAGLENGVEDVGAHREAVLAGELGAGGAAALHKVGMPVELGVERARSAAGHALGAVEDANTVVGIVGVFDRDGLDGSAFAVLLDVDLRSAEHLPAQRELPSRGYGRVGCGSPGVYGVPQGTTSEIGVTGSEVIGSGSLPGRWAIISRVRRPPGSVDSGHGSGFCPPQPGAVTIDCQYTIFVPSGDHAACERPFQFGSLTLPGLPSPALSCWP